jgi:hypothetical protein
MSSPTTTNKSPGKGGKSLDEKSLTGADGSLALTTSQPHQEDTTVGPGQNTAMQPSQLQPSPLASSRPKGKDFASLSARQPPPQQAQQQPPLAPAPQPMQQAHSGGKPKGKDFSQMASRMGPPMLQQPPSQQQPLQAPTQQQQQFQRLTPADGNQDAGLASQSQAAAGMPPFESTKCCDDSK